MARPLRVQFSGATYHVMSRGVDKRRIFMDDDDRRRWLSRLDDVCSRLGWELWAYCLMDNHFHLLVQTTRPTLARGMRDLNSRYSQSFNERHERVGHLLQGRYKALFVDDESYLHAVARYIVLNPVRSGLCGHPRDWRWSSYRPTLGEGIGPTSLRVDRILAVFDRDPAIARRAYVRFVTAGIGLPDPAMEPAHELFVGPEAFAARVTAGTPAPSTEVPRAQRQARKALGEFAAEHGRRNAAIAAAHASGLYTQTEIGAFFGLHYTSVCRIVRSERTMLQRKI